MTEQVALPPSSPRAAPERAPLDPQRALRLARKGFVAVVGTTVVLCGVVMIVLPGPAILVIPAGLAILATEFIWARRLLGRLKEQANRFSRRSRSGAERASTTNE
jgi:uncharacterized protein (TIGR02611 family)